jgi:hypothetical protein
MANLTKAEIITKLTDAGIEHDPEATVANLKALLPSDPVSTEATVCDQYGRPHRTYSLAVHGDNFKELAEEFVAQHDGWTVH